MTIAIDKIGNTSVREKTALFFDGFSEGAAIPFNLAAKALESKCLMPVVGTALTATVALALKNQSLEPVIHGVLTAGALTLGMPLLSVGIGVVGEEVAQKIAGKTRPVEYWAPAPSTTAEKFIHGAGYATGALASVATTACAASLVFPRLGM